MKFKSKIVEIEALQYGWNYGNVDRIIRWAAENGIVIHEVIHDRNKVSSEDYLIIPTLEGNMKAQKGDWIIKGTIGEFYACKDEVFQVKYEKVE